MQILYIIVGVLTVWIIGLTLVVVLMKLFFNRLGKDIGRENLIKLLQNLLKKEEDNFKQIENLQSTVSDIVSRDRFHIQKMGLVKFNPFEEVGGEHSFSLCLLDDNNSGVSLTGLHTRDRTRVYLKEIKKGKPGVDLSKEEMKALKVAMGS